MKRGPERTVIERKTIDHATVACTLACGHTVIVFASDAHHFLQRCRACLEEHRTRKVKRNAETR